jgi:hypothetical protein
MIIPEYVTKDEVRRVCKELKLRDWSELVDPEISIEEAYIVLKEVGTANMDIPLEIFQAGLIVELEHGTRFQDANVTNNHPILTGKIVLAHLKESLDYYARLNIAELEGDMLKYAHAGDGTRLLDKYKKLVSARNSLSEREVKSL